MAPCTARVQFVLLCTIYLGQSKFGFGPDADGGGCGAEKGSGTITHTTIACAIVVPIHNQHTPPKKANPVPWSGQEPEREWIFGDAWHFHRRSNQAIKPGGNQPQDAIGVHSANYASIAPFFFCQWPKADSPFSVWLQLACGYTTTGNKVKLLLPYQRTDALLRPYAVVLITDFSFVFPSHSFETQPSVTRTHKAPPRMRKKTGGEDNPT